MQAVTQTQADAMRQITPYSFHYFIKRAWHVIEPTTDFADAWHIEYLAEQLQKLFYRVYEKRENDGDLIINISPGTTKSTICSIMFVPWAWTIAPSMRFITGSHSMPVAIGLATKSRDIIKSDWYQSIYGDIYQLKYDMNKKTEYATDKAGARYITAVGINIMSVHGDINIIDDPLDPKSIDAVSEVKLKAARDWWDHVFSMRMTNKEVSSRLLIMQRLGEVDLTAHCLETEPEAFRQVCLPGEILSDNEDTVRPQELVKNYTNGLMDPVRLTLKSLQKIKKRLGSMGYAGQILQTPLPAEGVLLKVAWLKYFKLSELKDRAKSERKILTWNIAIDGAYTESTLNAPTALICFASIFGNTYVREVVNVWMELPELLNYIIEFAERNEVDPVHSSIFVEPKASGKSIVQMLKKTLKSKKYNTFEDKPPTTDKVARFKSVLPPIEAGKFYLLEAAPWLEEYTNQLRTFPNSKYKDMVDVTGIAIDRQDKKTQGGEIFSIDSV